MKTRIAALLWLCFVLFWGFGFSYPTPSSTPSPFSGITTRPTPAPPLTQYYLCFQDWSPSFVAVGSVSCGQGLSTAAGDIVFTGISTSNSGTPVGPWPATVTLVVNGVAYLSVPVNQTNGLIGSALLPGVQQLEIIVTGTGTYLGSSANVTTH